MFFGNAGFRSLVGRYRERRRLLQSVARLRADNQSLAQEWQRLQQDPSYMEYVIRKNLGYVKKGEVEYRWKPPEKQ